MFGWETPSALASSVSRWGPSRLSLAGVEEAAVLRPPVRALCRTWRIICSTATIRSSGPSGDVSISA